MPPLSFGFSNQETLAQRSSSQLGGNSRNAFNAFNGPDVKQIALYGAIALAALYIWRAV